MSNTNVGENKTSVKQQENVSMTSQQSSSKEGSSTVLYWVIIILLLVLIGILGWFWWSSNSRSEGSNVTMSTQQQAPSEKPEANVDNHDLTPPQANTQNCPACPKTEEFPSRELALVNGGKVKIPTGWYVKSVYVNKRTLTETEANDYVNPANHGYWPIYEGFKVSITNGSSVITFGNKSMLIPGGVGFVMKDVDNSWEVVKEPKLKASEMTGSYDRNKLGVAYKPDAGVDEYVYIVEDDVTGGSNKYADPNIGPSVYIFSYKGDESDRKVMNDLFWEACVKNSSKLCGN